MTHFCQSETKAIQNLLNSSVEPEPESEISISPNDKWSEVCSWQKISPMCHCFEGKVNKKMKKKTNTSKTIKDNNKGKYKNKKIYQNVGGGGDAAGNQVAVINQATQNRNLRSTNVLSYDMPSWRFIMNSNDFNYINRYSIIDEPSVIKLSLDNDDNAKVEDDMRHHQSQTNNGSRKSEEVIDPAGLLDENLLRAYKACKSFNPNVNIKHLFHRLLADNQKFQNDKDVNSRFYSRSVPVATQKNFDWDDGCEDDESLKKQRQYFKSKLRRSRSKHERKKQPECVKSKLDGRVSLCLPKVSHQYQLSNNSTSNPDLTLPRSEKLYLPLLNHSNYNSKLKITKTSKVELPSISGVKLCISTTSNTGLIL